jgi:iron complex outermembrane recepter protein
MRAVSKNKISAVLLTATMLAGLAPMAAQAQSATAEATTSLEEVVVTAQRRQESVQDVPIAVSAFTAGELERRNISEALDLIQYIPNLMGSNNTGLGTANAYYLRGIGNTESIATFDPPVGTYIDDIYVSRQNGNNFSFFDVERVEVLRGPQGTLFGRNTTGGAINVILKKPGEDFGGFAEASFGRFDRIGLRGSVDVPLSASFKTKISGYFNDDSGYVKNVTTGEKLNDIHNYGGRIAVQANVTEDLTWDIALVHTRDQSSNILNFDCNPANPSDCDGRFVTTGLRKEFATAATQYVGTTGAPLGIVGDKANLPLGNDVKSTMLSSNISWAFGENGSIEAITGLIDMTQEFNLDFFDGRGGPSVNFVAGTDGLPRPTSAVASPTVRGFRTGGFAITNDGEHKQFTQELKISNSALDGKLEYVTGLFYINERNKTDFADVFTLATLPFPPFSAVPTGFPLLLADRVVGNKTTAWAGYLQADFSVTEMIKLTAGIRFTNEKKTVTVADNRASCNDGTVEATCMTSANISAAGVPREQRAKLWTPRIAINVTPTDDILLFASATRGFKSGGWNARSTASNLFLPFAPEKVWSYEAGLKSEWLDNRLRLNVTGFYLDVKDLQVPSAFLNPATGALTFITRNFADLRNKGAEIEFQAVPVEGLTLFANLGLQDAKYKVDQDAPLTDAFGVLSVRAQQAECRAALGNIASPRGDTNTSTVRAQRNCGVGIVTLSGDIAPPVRSPDVTFSVGVNYEIPMASLGAKLVPSVNVSYIGKQEVGTSALSIYNDGGVLNGTSGDFVTGSESKSVTRVNASLALITDDDAWSMSAECDNCFGAVQVQSTLSNYTYLSPPSTWTVRLKRKF